MEVQGEDQMRHEEAFASSIQQPEQTGEDRNEGESRSGSTPAADTRKTQRIMGYMALRRSTAAFGARARRRSSRSAPAVGMGR